MCATLVTGATAGVPASAGSPALVVLVRQPDGVVAFDPQTGETRPAGAPLGCLPESTPKGQRRSAASTPSPPAVPVAGDVQYWMGTPSGDAFIVQVAGSASATWWYWQPDDEPRSLSLPLPDDVEPALASGTAARWFHGATVDAHHLGSGALRLLAVDLADGMVVLDDVMDRRLELAATKVGDDGAVVAHVQGGNTQVDIWAADLRYGSAPVEVNVPIEPAAAVAPSAIELRVAVNGDRMVVAAGPSWAWPDHPNPFVIIVSSDSGAAPVVSTVQGAVVGLAELC